MPQGAEGNGAAMLSVTERLGCVQSRMECLVRLPEARDGGGQGPGPGWTLWLEGLKFSDRRVQA